VHRYKEYRAANPSASEADSHAELTRLVQVFAAVHERDRALIKLGAAYTDAAVPAAVANCTPAVVPAAAGGNVKLQAIGTLCWVYLRLRPTGSKWPFFGYLKALYELDAEPVDEPAIRAWHACHGVADAPTTPATAAAGARIVTASTTGTTSVAAATAGVAALSVGSATSTDASTATSPSDVAVPYLPSGAADITVEELAKLRENCNSFVQWLDQADDDDEEEDEDEED
jgi:hypothetical protein